MKTDQLVAMLAAGAGPAPRAVAIRRLAPAMGLGFAASAALALAVIGLVPTHILQQPMWWLKFGYVVALAGASAWLVARLARPAARMRAAWRTVGLIALAMAVMATTQLIASDPAERAALLTGHSWRTCFWSVLVLSLPGLAGVFWALRGLAPTRLRVAGLAAGLLAGAVGAAGYALSCTELSMAFVATWYSLGIVMAGALGALLGPRLLRW